MGWIIVLPTLLTIPKDIACSMSATCHLRREVPDNTESEALEEARLSSEVSRINTLDPPSCNIKCKYNYIYNYYIILYMYDYIYINLIYIYNIIYIYYYIILYYI